MLPDLPSKLLEVAILDLEKAYNNEKMRVRMSDWLYFPDPGHHPDVCHVCLAGAVMRLSLGLGPFPGSCHRYPNSAATEIDAQKLRLLNDLRRGDIDNAIGRLDIPRPPGLKYFVRVAEWDDENPEPFFRSMCDLIVYLESFGL